MAYNDLGRDYRKLQVDQIQVTEEQRKAAALVCADNATDPEDLKLILKTLGLMDVR